MKGKHVLRWAAGAAVLLLVAAACSSGGGGNKESQSPGATSKGGTYRTAIEDFFLTDGMDPTGEYTTSGAELQGEMYVRNLVAYAHVAGEAGGVLYPDITTEIPKPTERC